jgi:large subunit ribosomal protein L27e
MGKFYKPGKVVVVLNGRNAGAKGVIIKSNYDNAKDRKYPHCLVVGLSKGPKKPTKKNIAKLQARIKKLEASKDSNDKLNALKSFGVFIKTYNMSHLLATRYTVKEEFGITKSLDKLDDLAKKVKEDKAELDSKEKNKKDENAQKEIEALKTKYGNTLNEYKNEVKNTKVKIGGEMYKRFMQGFNKGKKEEEIENQQHTQFLFKKLKF